MTATYLPVIGATRAPNGTLTPVMAPTNTGPQGNAGWTPALAGEADGVRTLIKVIDWTGGQGTKPATGMYIGTTGYVTTKALAFNFNASKRVAFFTGTTAALTGIATIGFGADTFANPPAIAAFATPAVLAGALKVETVAGTLTKTGVQIKVTQAALLTGIVTALVGATVTVLAVET